MYDSSLIASVGYILSTTVAITAGKGVVARFLSSTLTAGTLPQCGGKGRCLCQKANSADLFCLSQL